MKVYSFPRGGVVFTDPSVPSRDSSTVAFLPALSIIPLVQHTGGRAYPVVSVGDHVREGMLIGRGQGPGSANIHATVPGRVIRMVSWKTAQGQANDALVIRMEGSFEKLGKREEIFPWQGLPPFDLQRIIAEYGIVEMEGTGRPVSDILSSLRPVKDPVTLVVCCVFDDPWLAADYVLCRERTRAVVEGSAIVGRASRAVRIVFVVSRGEKELGTMLLTEAESFGIPAAMVLVSSRYPQRNRRELDLVLKKYGKRESLELGYMLPFGPATLAAIHDAVKLKKSVLSRYVAVGGSAVKKAQVMRVRIGTRIGEVFAECGGFIDKPGRIIAGSPLMGQVVTDLDEPVIKTTYALFAVKGKQNRTVPGNCMGCGECRLVCPVGLDPEEIFKMNGIQGSGQKTAECHGCGCCDVVCPARIPLSLFIANSAYRGE